MNSNANDKKQPQLPDTGFVTLKVVLQHMPVSKSTWYGGIKTGEYPKPYRLSKGRVGWKVQDIRQCIDTREQRN